MSERSEVKVGAVVKFLDGPWRGLCGNVTRIDDDHGVVWVRVPGMDLDRFGSIDSLRVVTHAPEPEALKPWSEEKR